MKKRVFAFFLAVILTSFCFVVPASAEDLSEQEITIAVVYRGNLFEEKALRLKNDKVLVPVTWIKFYGAMQMTEEDGFYKFYYPDQENTPVFAKRIYIEKDGSGFDVRYTDMSLSWFQDFYIYKNWTVDTLSAIGERSKEKICEAWNIKEKKLEKIKTEHFNSHSIYSGKFSKKEIYNGMLYLPVSEVLPFINATVGISKYGEILINPNCISISQAITGSNISELCFDAHRDLAVDGDSYAEGLAGTAYVFDTVVNLKIDRIIFHRAADISDYESIFKRYLLEDETYLSAFDKETTPQYAQYNLVADSFKEGETALELLDKSYDYMKEMQIPEELFSDDYQVFFKDYEGTNFKGMDIVKGFTKIFDYHRTYSNQVVVHRDMLTAVYNKNTSSNTHSNDYVAANNISKLYGEQYADRLIAATDSALRDFTKEALLKKTDDVLGSKIVPYKLSLEITKRIIPESFKTIGDTALIMHMDDIAHASYEAYGHYKNNNDFSADNLNKLRLAAIMALVSSRDTYECLWGKNDPRIAEINKALTKLYLAADGIECDSSDYYGNKKKELKKQEETIKTFEEATANRDGALEALENLVGTWASTIDGQYGEITFNRDFTGYIEAADHSEEFKWEVHGDTIIINGESDKEFQYKVENSVLFLTVDGETHMFMAKKGFSLSSLEDILELYQKLLEWILEMLSYILSQIEQSGGFISIPL